MVAIIDRMEGGAAAFAAKGYAFSSLLTIRDFGIEPPSQSTVRRSSIVHIHACSESRYDSPNLTEETRHEWKPRCIVS